VIVVDASALTELLLQTELGSRVEARLFRGADALHTPHLLDVEIVQALRRLVRARQLHADRAQEALDDLAHFNVRRHAHTDFLGRAWELRDNLTAYDAMYVALAEALDAPLVTCDAPLAATPGHAVRIEVIR
jgi:predicted nucleic acid-binding protein